MIDRYNVEHTKLKLNKVGRKSKPENVFKTSLGEWAPQFLHLMGFQGPAIY